MTDREQLKLLLDIPESDTTEDGRLDLFLAGAEAYFRGYCRVGVIREDMRPVIVAMAAEDYGRSGGEGVSYRTVSGASESYRGAYSDRTLGAMKRFRRAGTVGD